MPIFIKLKDNDRIKLFRSIKEKINISWDSFYPSLGIRRSMFFHYLSGKHNLPQKLFFKLERIARLKISNYGEVKQVKYVKKEIREPKMDIFLAEILGVLNGDGHISNFKYEVCVVGDIKEKKYSNYLKKLFEKTFGISFTIYKGKSYFKLRNYSKEISCLLTKKYNLPKGNKIGKLRIPKQVLKSNNLLIAYIRGLYDTDGSFYIRRKKEPVVQITSADSLFLSEIRDALISLNFNAVKGNQRIFIYTKNHIDNFFKIIRPANSKHLKKYQNYLKLSKRG
ncbi:MAG TPA: hypothetical protein ENG87_02515 [Candidatus Pacearchaeota archaeon]|nr:hypothetical protein BMS3Abin17_01128 [archaeon BMS3Abin17]HDK42227.1 hypothetical protein [Candidatus Pacearchaeota archaeon]HDZ60653.1 hypothetical protein [Candidatus Pacearchaeota archaeon]